MPVFIPKPDEQANFWQPYLEPGEQVQAAWWLEQRLPLLVAMLLEQGGAIAELIFSAMRHCYFGALTDRRVPVLVATGRQERVAGNVAAIPRIVVIQTRVA